MNDGSTQYCLFDTAIGTCGVAWSPHGVTRLQLPETDQSATEKRLQASAAKASQKVPAQIHRLMIDMQHYMGGHRVGFDLSAFPPHLIGDPEL